MKDNSLKHDEDIDKYVKLKKFGFYLFSPVLVPMNICFSTLFMTVLVVYKSLLDPFVYNYREFWKTRKEYGSGDFIKCTLEACMWMVGRIIMSPVILPYLWITVAVSSISYLGRVGDYVISNAPSIAAVSTFKPFTDKDTSVTKASFWLPPKTNDDEILNSGFSAILGYMFGLYRFEVSMAMNNIVTKTSNNNDRKLPAVFENFIEVPEIHMANEPLLNQRQELEVYKTFG